MQYSRTVQAICLGLAACVLWSCDSPAEPPPDVSGVYYLVEALGEEIPVRIDTVIPPRQPGDWWQMEWTAGRLILVEQGRYRSDQVIKDTFEDGDTVRSQVTTEGSYHVEGSIIHFQPDADLYYFPLSRATLDGPFLRTDTHGGVYEVVQEQSPDASP